MRVFSGSLAGSNSLIGEDRAINYGGSFAGASNFGYGFDAWDFTSTGNAGGFIGSSYGGLIDTNGSSFGLYGNGAGSNFIDVRRNLPANLSVGYALSAAISVNFRNGNKGFSVYHNNTWDPNQEVFNFNVGGGGLGNYIINGVSTGQDYSPTMVARIVLKKTNFNSYSYSVTLGTTTYTENDITRNGYSNIRGFKFYIANTEGAPNNDLYFNSIKVYKIDEPISTIPTSTFTTFVSYE
jgi:hypothetical protein